MFIFSGPKLTFSRHNFIHFSQEHAFSPLYCWKAAPIKTNNEDSISQCDSKHELQFDSTYFQILISSLGRQSPVAVVLSYIFAISF